MHQAEDPLERQVDQDVHDAAAEDHPEDIPDTLEGVRRDLSEQREQVLLYKVP